MGNMSMHNYQSDPLNTGNTDHSGNTCAQIYRKSVTALDSTGNTYKPNSRLTVTTVTGIPRLIEVIEPVNLILTQDQKNKIERRRRFLAYQAKMIYEKCIGD